MSRTSLSAVVLQRQSNRRKDRRRERFETAFLVTVIFLFAVTVLSCGSAIYFGIVRDRPTWASFASAAGTQANGWKVNATNPDGVPTTVLINGEEWSLVEAYSFESRATAAATFCDHNTIAYLQADNPTILRDDVWHEIFHAAACAHSGDSWWNSDDPNAIYHPGIYNLGHFMAEFSLANPQFIEWSSNAK